MAENSAAERAKKQREERERKRAEAKKRQEEQKQRQEQAQKAQESGDKSEKNAQPQRRDWSSDLGGLIKSAGKKAGGAADAVSDVLVDKEAWGDIVSGDADKRDYLNAALDATMLIPGVGLAGGAARIAARQGAKGLMKGGIAANRLDAPLSAAAQRAAARGAAGQPAGAASLGARTAPRRAAGPAQGPAEKLLAPVRNKLDDVALKAERGGKRIGLGQSKKRVAVNAGLTVGANLAAGAYNDALGTAGQDPKVVPGPAGGQGNAVYLIGGEPYPLEFGTGGEMSVPASTQRALAGYYAQGGSPDGAQVVYLSGS